MGNHCLDVMCTGCGRCWCLRCNDNSKPNPAYAQKARERRWEGKGNVWENESCCAGYEVVDQSILYG